MHIISALLSIAIKGVLVLAFHHIVYYVLSIMGVSKRSMLVTVCILFVIINMLETVTLSKFPDYSDPIGDVSSQCQLTHHYCKPPRSPNPMKRISKIGGIEGIQRTSSLDNTVRMTDAKNDIDHP